MIGAKRLLGLEFASPSVAVVSGPLPARLAGTDVWPASTMRGVARFFFCSSAAYGGGRAEKEQPPLATILAYQTQVPARRAGRGPRLQT